MVLAACDRKPLRGHRIALTQDKTSPYNLINTKAVGFDDHLFRYRLEDLIKTTATGTCYALKSSYPVQRH